MDLDLLKYSELQKLAKNAGIRANQKIDKLVRALKDHYCKEEQCGTVKAVSNSTAEPSSYNKEKGKPPEDEEERMENLNQQNKVPTRGRKKRQNAAKGKQRHVPLNKQNDTPKMNVSYTKSPKTTPDSKHPTLTTKTPEVNKGPKIVKPIIPGKPQTPLIGKPAIVNPSSAKKPTFVNTPSVKPMQILKATNKPISLNRASGTPKVGTPGLRKTGGAIVNPSPAKRTPETRRTSSSRGNTPSLLSPKPTTPLKSPGQKRNTLRKSGEQAGEEVDVPRQKRKRKSTFELDEATLGAQATPEAMKTTKRAGTSAQKSTNSSPGVQAMIDSMSANVSSAERKKQLLGAIEKRVQGKVKSSPHTGPVTQIPRFAAFLAKRKQEQKKTVTPGNKDWEKVHKKEFSKFDSIDVYLEKKRKRAEELTASVKKARTVLQEVQQAVTKLKSKRTPSMGRTKAMATQPFKPTVVSTKNMNLNFGATAPTSKTPRDKKSGILSKPFKPTITSTKDTNFNFSALKTPEIQPCTPANVTGRKSVGASQMSARKSIGASAARKSMSNTPFQFTGNLNTTTDLSKSTTKPIFDLKASLARPITWKPHTGKLKPLETGYKSLSSASKQVASQRVEVFKSAVNKTRLTYSRQDRRAATAAKRAENKNHLQMMRRGIKP